jgi:hypothetical protein
MRASSNTMPKKDRPPSPGEAGLGKTTLVKAFLQELGGYGELQIAHGQCIEHYGVGEACLSILEALGQLCKAPAGQVIVTLLTRQAPTCVVQMPWLVTGAESDALQRWIVGVTQERRLGYQDSLPYWPNPTGWTPNPTGGCRYCPKP